MYKSEPISKSDCFTESH